MLIEAADAGLTAPVSGADRPIVAARSVSNEPSQVVIEADASEPGMLVLTDTFYPGWVARVDGEPREILRANYLFRAVSLEAGRHRVVFRYQPWSFRLGVALTATSLVAVVAVSVTRRARR